MAIIANKIDSKYFSFHAKDEHGRESRRNNMSERKNKMPERFMMPQVLATSIDHIIGAYVHGEPSRLERYPHAQTFSGEWLFDFKIPPFQRAVVWSDEQCIRFIESCWLGFDIGSYVVNKVEWTAEKIHEADGYLLDGLQRLTALKRYVDNEFQVFGYFWKELDEVEQHRFENITFSQNRVYIKEDDKLREVYNRLNFGGTAHTEDERA